MASDLGLTVRIHRADGFDMVVSGNFFTSLMWWPGLLWPGAWRNANDNGEGTENGRRA